MAEKKWASAYHHGVHWGLKVLRAAWDEDLGASGGVDTNTLSDLTALIYNAKGYARHYTGATRTSFENGFNDVFSFFDGKVPRGRSALKKKYLIDACTAQAQRFAAQRFAAR